MQMEFGGIERLFIELIDQVGEGDQLFQTRSREGIFSPALTMWLSINCWAKGEKGLAAALEALQAGEASEVFERNTKTRRGKIKGVSTNSGGLSRARERLKLDDIRQLSQRMNELLIREKTPEKLWRGRRVYLFDGTVVTLTRNAKVLEEFKPIRNQHGESYTPKILVGCCHEVFSGIALNPRFGAYRGKAKTHEAKLFVDVMDEVPESSLLIADRGLGIFPIAYEAQRRNHQILVRLSSTRANALARQAYAKGEYADREVVWKFSGSKMKELEIPKDAQLSGRFIKWTAKRKGSAPLKLFFFTTSSEPAKDLIDLYLQRERIENDIRTLKYTIGLERLISKSPPIIGQELLLGVLAYNLIRSIMTQAAKELGLDARRISFTRAVRWIQLFGNKIRDATSAEEIEDYRKRFLTALYQQKLPKRIKQRIEPRKLARERQAYPLMKKSRAEEQKIAKKILSDNGHRGYLTSVSRKY